MDQKGKVALVTGASSGIGLELARLHAKRGGDLIIVARRKDRLDMIKEELEKEYGVAVQVIVKDLTQPNAPHEVYKEAKGPVDYLINNAGFGLLGFYNDTPWKRNKEMIDLNITALCALTHFFLQDMVERRSGKILNVSSIAGFLPGPLQPAYFATKAFEISFSQAIGNEVADKNITVSVLCPGPVDTEFAEVAGMSLFKSSLKKSRVATAEETAIAGYEGMLKGKSVIIPELYFKFAVTIMRFLPRGLMTRFSRKIIEDYKL
jgi:short-subunit dehydrogenase